MLYIYCTWCIMVAKCKCAEVAFVTEIDNTIHNILKKNIGLDPFALGGLLVLSIRQSLLPC